MRRCIFRPTPFSGLLWVHPEDKGDAHPSLPLCPSSPPLFCIQGGPTSLGEQPQMETQTASHPITLKIGLGFPPGYRPQTPREGPSTLQALRQLDSWPQTNSVSDLYQKPHKELTSKCAPSATEATFLCMCDNASPHPTPFKINIFARLATVCLFFLPQKRERKGAAPNTFRCLNPFHLHTSPKKLKICQIL